MSQVYLVITLLTILWFCHIQKKN